MNLEYIDMHTFSAKSNSNKEYSWMYLHPHGKNGWGYIVIDKDTNPANMVGYIDITNYKTSFSKDTKRINVFYINTEYRGLGIGNKLMQLAIERNAYVVDTSPNPYYEPDHINALHLYEKYGFRCRPKIKNSKLYKRLKDGFVDGDPKRSSPYELTSTEHGIPYWHVFIHLYRDSIEPKNNF